MDAFNNQRQAQERAKQIELAALLQRDERLRRQLENNRQRIEEVMGKRSA